MADDSRQDGVVVALFDEKTIPPPAGAAAPTEDDRPINAQTVVAAYVEGVQDATGERPTKRVLLQVARQAKELLGEGRDPARLMAAAKSLGRKVQRGYTDLGQEYLMHAPATGANGVPGHGPRQDVGAVDWSKGFNMKGDRR